MSIAVKYFDWAALDLRDVLSLSRLVKAFFVSDTGEDYYSS